MRWSGDIYEELLGCLPDEEAVALVNELREAVYQEAFRFGADQYGADW